MKEKFALVTGANGGIGSAIALKLGKNGYKVVLNYHLKNTVATETIFFNWKSKCNARTSRHNKAIADTRNGKKSYRTIR